MYVLKSECPKLDFRTSKYLFKHTRGMYLIKLFVQFANRKQDMKLFDFFFMTHSGILIILGSKLCL